jgi:photosystem II stability/assembly factor-like uncharacterized protein
LLRLLSIAAAMWGAFGVAQSVSAEQTTLAALASGTHFHGLVARPDESSPLLLATHHGLYAVSRHGVATKVSESSDDFVSLAIHPAEPAILFASGHPERRGNLGFVRSGDGGRTWSQLSQGAEEYGTADFHKMDVSRADPNVIYGVYRELQVSHDGGRTWKTVDVPPRRLIDLAASAKDPRTLYAATEDGLLMSSDGGRTWNRTKLWGRPVCLVNVTADGRMYAFMVGAGLMRGTEGSNDWETVSAEFGDRVLAGLAADPSNADRLYAFTQFSEMLTSGDGGRTWKSLGGGD